MKGIVVELFVSVAIAQFMANPTESAITCSQVDEPLANCIPYLLAGLTSSGKCCDSMKNLKVLTPTTADRQAACSCIKAAAARYPNIKEDEASSLPAKCGVPMSIPISKNINCNDAN